jgi:hypothetical protein
MWIEGFENPNPPIRDLVLQCAWLFLIGQGHSSRLSFISGAVLVQIECYGIDFMDTMYKNPP